MNGIETSCVAGQTFSDTEGLSSCKICSSPSSSYYTTSACSTTAETQMLPCTSPSNTQFTTSTCFSGSTHQVGYDAVVLTCASASTGFGYTVSYPCVSGTSTTLGSNTVMMCASGYYGSALVTNFTTLSGCQPCTVPNSGFYTVSTCTPTSNTVIEPCFDPSTLNGFYYTNTICSTGSALLLGNQTSYILCNHFVRDGYYASKLW